MAAGHFVAHGKLTLGGHINDDTLKDAGRKLIALLHAVNFTLFFFTQFIDAVIINRKDFTAFTVFFKVINTEHPDLLLIKAEDIGELLVLFADSKLKFLGIILLDLLDLGCLFDLVSLGLAPALIALENFNINNNTGDPG